MMQTFTPSTDLTEKKEQEPQAVYSLPQVCDPSDETINTILNYSKNLEVKKSQLVKEIELLRS